MFSDPQFWVAVSFLIFILAIFNPVRKILTSSLDQQINDIKNKIDEAKNLKIEAEQAFNDLKNRENEVELEIKKLRIDSEEKISELKKSYSIKLSEQIEKHKLLADNKIEQLVRDTNISIKNYITSVAIEATINILNKNLSSEKKSDLINVSIKELNDVLKAS